jgi:cation diffusion facilitator family transporter
MSDCCEVRRIPHEQRRMLQIVLGINVAMFLTESLAGLLAHSTALFADSIDMLADAIVYGFSLYAISRGIAWQARVALLKGGMMAAFGIGVFLQAVVKILHGLTPTVEVMGVVGTLALAANVLCLALLRPRRDDDVNMRSAWVCSRNDVVGNLGVLAAAGAVSVTGSPWPDVLVGLAVAALFGRSAARVIREAAPAAVPRVKGLRLASPPDRPGVTRAVAEASEDVE